MTWKFQHSERSGLGTLSSSRCVQAVEDSMQILIVSTIDQLGKNRENLVKNSNSYREHAAGAADLTACCI